MFTLAAAVLGRFPDRLKDESHVKKKEQAHSMLMDAQTHRICQSVTTNRWTRRSDGIRVSSRVERELPSLQLPAARPAFCIGARRPICTRSTHSNKYHTSK